MKASRFVTEDLIQEKFGIESNRITKLVSALRVLDKNAFPVGAKKESDEGHVNVMHAANLLYVLSLNPNPFNKMEFAIKVNARLTMKSEGRFFLNDLAEILTTVNAGTFWTGKLVKEIRISVDRSYAEIVFDDEKKVYCGKDCEPKFIERFTVLNPDFLQNYCNLISRTGDYDHYWGDKAPEDFHITRSRITDYIQRFTPIE